MTDNNLSFITVICQNPIFCKELSSIVDTGDYDKLSKTIISVTKPSGRTLPIVRSILESEFEKNVNQPGSIMRANCVASKISGDYSRQLGQQFLKDAIGDFIFRIVNDSSLSLEIDPDKLGKTAGVEAQIKKNQELLLAQSQEVFDRITSADMLEITPRAIRAIAYFTSEYATKYAPDQKAPLVGGFVMLRLVNPSLLTPEAYGLLPHGLTPSVTARRNLTLITKLLQNLSNNVQFGSKEQFMVPMNSFIDANSAKMSKYLSELATDPLATSGTAPFADCKNPPAIEFDTTKVKLADLNILYGFFYQHREALLQKCSNEAATATLAAAIKAIGAPSRKAAAPAALKSTASSNSTSAAKPADSSSSSSAAAAAASSSNNDGERVVGRVIRSGELSRLDHAVRHARFHFVLTDCFLYYFRAKGDLAAYRAVSLDDILLSNEPDDAQGNPSFSLLTTGKTHRLQADSAAVTKAWIAAIRTAVADFLNRAASIASTSVILPGHSSAASTTPQASVADEAALRKALTLDARMASLAAGARLAYAVRLIGAESQQRRAWLLCAVAAFGEQWTVKKTYEDFCALHQAITKKFANFALPPVPKVNDNETTSLASDLLMKSKKISGVSNETTVSLNVKIGDDGRPNEDLVCLIKFLRAFIMEMSADVIAQSDEILAFLDILSPLRAATAGNLSQLYFLKDTAVDFNQRGDSGRAAMHIAVLKQQREAVEFLGLEGKADVNVADRAGNTPLHLAVYRNNADIVALLLSLGARINAFNNLEQKFHTTLMAACEGGNRATVLRLISRGAKINAIDAKGQSPLHLAIKAGSASIALLMIEKGADVAVADKSGATALSLAASAGLHEVVAVLVQQASCNANIVDSHGRSPVHSAASVGDVKSLTLLCAATKPTVKVNCGLKDREGNTPLHLAVHNGHDEAVAVLCRAFGVDLDTTNAAGNTALHIAAKRNSVMTVERLVRAGASLSVQSAADGRTPLHAAALANAVPTVVCISKFDSVDLPMKTDIKGRTALHCAAFLGYVEMTATLIDICANAIEARDKEGNTPLMLACWAKRAQIVRILVDKGADVNARDTMEGQTALHICAGSGSVDVLDVLLTAKPNINVARTSDGFTPLHFAVAQEQEAIVRSLAKAKADLNAQDKKKNTPLHIATGKQLTRIALLLAANGALLLASNSEGRTPTTNVKARFKMALDEAAQRYANRKGTERAGSPNSAISSSNTSSSSSSTTSSSQSSSTTAANNDASFEVDDLSAKVDDVIAAPVTQTSTRAVTDVTAQFDRAAPSAVVVEGARDDVSFREDPSPGVPCLLRDGAEITHRSEISSSAFKSMKSLCDELQKQLKTGPYFSLAYIDEDNDEVIVPNLDDDESCSEIRRFGKAIIVMKS